MEQTKDEHKQNTQRVEYKCPTPDEFLEEVMKPQRSLSDLHNNYEKAKAEFEQILQTDPNHWSVYSNTDGTKESYWMRSIKHRMGENRYVNYTHSNVNRNLRRYLYQDCIIAYCKDLFFGCFIIKSKNKFFAFMCKDTDIHLGGMGYSLMDTSLEQAMNVIEKIRERYPEDKSKVNVDKPELYQQMKNWILAQAISG